MKKSSLLAPLACLVLLSACSIPKLGADAGNETIVTDTPTETTDTNTANTPADTTATGTQTETTGEVTNVSDTPAAIAEGGIYMPYTPTAVKQAKGKIVLFFYASWSPSSIKVNKNIEDNVKKIPTDLTILRVNFDDATDLKTAYNVDEQATFVEVDNDGNLIKKWRGESTLTDIVSKTTEQS